MFEADVFGPVNLIKAVLPGMRAHRRGHIVNISSVGGYVTFPAVGYYHMAKFALEGLSDTLAKGFAPFGIGATVVAPGAFRTDFRGPSGKQSAIRIDDYADTAGAARDKVLAGHGTQRGDPMRGAQAIITAVEAPQPPVHLIIGGDGLDQVRQKITELQGDFDTWEKLTRSTDFQLAAPQPWRLYHFVKRPDTVGEVRSVRAGLALAGFPALEAAHVAFVAAASIRARRHCPHRARRVPARQLVRAPA